MPKKGNKYLIPSPSEDTPRPKLAIHAPVSISFQHFSEGAKYCLSLCNKDQVRLYLKTLRLLTTLGWMDVIGTGGRPGGGKTGLGYTLYRDLRNTKFKRLNLSEDITISGLRAGRRERLYGFHINNVYYILAFAPDHDL